MKTLCIIRHAKAEHGGSLQPDHARPLAARGKSDAALMGMQLFTRGLLPEAILASSALRTSDTAAILADELSLPEGSILLSDELYNASPRDLRGFLADLADDVRTAFLVGHNPEVTLLSEELSGRSLGSIPTCGIVCVDLAISRWKELLRLEKGTLRFLEVPGSCR